MRFTVLLYYFCFAGWIPCTSQHLDIFYTIIRRSAMDIPNVCVLLHLVFFLCYGRPRYQCSISFSALFYTTYAISLRKHSLGQHADAGSTHIISRSFSLGILHHAASGSGVKGSGSAGYGSRMVSLSGSQKRFKEAKDQKAFLYSLSHVHMAMRKQSTVSSMQ